MAMPVLITTKTCSLTFPQVKHTLRWQKSYTSPSKPRFKIFASWTKADDSAFTGREIPPGGSVLGSGV